MLSLKAYWFLFLAIIPYVYIFSMNRPRIFISESAEETESFAQNVALNISGTACLCLYGDLGAGKTTFVRGLAKALGIKSKIQSTTFTYNRIHKGRCSLLSCQKRRYPRHRMAGPHGRLSSARCHKDFLRVCRRKR
ncbi:tRNA (adenosine(37)-N6)-threonylcarbamoyltransferase complex ATPase subunit type 1 TsaE [Candidatus Peregrinibacteria bacterium]|nr:tRNA (adenosine(37)-N6)-threonylcarbamoyltransferase complex ATPase subunit type 1 TsaE [Candidatus Peregrinibacteria bacterium]